MAPPTTAVLIVGAGPTGLTMANILAREGVPFRLVDKKSGPSEESRALLVQPRTIEYWDKLGLADAALREGKTSTSFKMLVEGRPFGELRFGGPGEDRTPYPFALILEQSKTERLLIEGLRAAGSRVEWETELLDLDVTAERTTTTVRGPDGSEETITAGWVVGADGVRSPIRHLLGLGFEGVTHEQGFFLADVDMEWDKGHEDLFADLTNDGFFAFFPMPGDGHFRLLGNLTPELWAKHDRGEEVRLDDIRAILALKSGVDATLVDARWISTYRVHTRMADRFRLGRVFLAGDAAHTHSPAASQGMNTGIGDAFNLGWKLALVARGEADEGLLASYEAERKPVARAVMGLTDRVFALEVTTNPLLNRFRLTALPRLLGLTTRFRAANRFLFGLVSQIRTAYRGSPAVDGSAGRRVARPGDRAPYGRFEGGESLYALLRGTDHHLLLFEGRRPDRALLEATGEILATLLDRYAVPIRVHPIATMHEGLHGRYGADRPTLVLVRPDGHIAYRGDTADVVALTRYLDRLFLRQANRGQGSSAPLHVITAD
jgi:2-polyprenyl-6-methoxyphenol hydroxylase-like FAD-dependent oxidoreductase